MCFSSPFGVGQLPEDVISGVYVQFGVIGESAIQCYTKVDKVGAVLKRCSRPCDVKGSVCFPVSEMERAHLCLHKFCL